MKKSSAELRSTKLHSKNDDPNSEIKVPKKRHTSPEERQQVIDELRLIPKKNVYF